MSSIQQLVAWMLSNKVQVFRFVRVLQLLSGLLLLGFSYFAGREPFRLIRAGVRTQGLIVDYQEQHFQHISTGGSYNTSAFMPIVEFHSGERLIRFKDWKGTNSTGDLHSPVTVLYDPANPISAMIDRPVMNWIPWAPIFAVGFFLFLVAMKGFQKAGLDRSP
jgi:hypothetical protein